jgi:hypothetical protein
VSEDGSEVRWVDVEAVARVLGVSGRSIRRACNRGQLTWRRVGFGFLRSRRYQVILAEVRDLLTRDDLDNLDKSDKE